MGNGMKYSTEKIWEDFSAALRAYISGKIYDRASAEDVLQDVFVKIHANIDSLKDDTRVRSWVYQIARNTVIDYYKKNKYRLEDIGSVLKEDDGTLSDTAELDLENPAKEVEAGLIGMIEALPEKYAQALLLVEFEGMPQTELAKKLGISVSGIKSRVQRARMMLRDSLMRCCHFEFDRYGKIIDFRPNTCCCCCE